MTDQRIFISHASENAAIADRIVAYLESRGVPCWISSRDIHPKMIYAEAIAEAMRAAQSCAVIVSASSNNSQAVKRELELASRYDKPFIPIRIDATEPGPGLDYYLTNTQWVDYGAERERALDRIVAAYAARTGAPVTPPPASKTKGGGINPLLIAAGLCLLALAGGGAWYWGSSQQQAREPAGPGAFLVGDFHWEGVACGAGPRVTQAANGDLIFAMAGAPTYRHKVRGARRNAEGYAVAMQTRVIEPAAQAGQAYTFRARTRDSAIEVITQGETNEWERCP